MIRVKRSAKPHVLCKKEILWKARIAAACTLKEREKSQSTYRHKQIKEALTAMFQGKCAYCESAISHIDYGHIEHYKPKALPEFYELAVDWDNLLLACGRCNGIENKGVKFPGRSEGGPLINPTEDDPSEHLVFDFDTVAKLANVLDKSERGEITCKTLGLNRLELLHRRSDFVKKLWVIADRYAQDSAAREIIDLAVKDDAEYSAFARELKRIIATRSNSSGPLR